MDLKNSVLTQIFSSMVGRTPGIGGETYKTAVAEYKRYDPHINQ